MITWHESILYATGHKDNIKKFAFYLVKQKLTTIKSITIEIINPVNNEIRITCPISSFDINLFNGHQITKCRLYNLHYDLEQLKEEYKLSGIDLLLSITQSKGATIK